MHMFVCFFLRILCSSDIGHIWSKICLFPHQLNVFFVCLFVFTNVYHVILDTGATGVGLSN